MKTYVCEKHDLPHTPSSICRARGTPDNAKISSAPTALAGLSVVGNRNACISTSGGLPCPCCFTNSRYKRKTAYIPYHQPSLAPKNNGETSRCLSPVDYDFTHSRLDVRSVQSRHQERFEATCTRVGEVKRGTSRQARIPRSHAFMQERKCSVAVQCSANAKSQRV